MISFEVAWKGMDIPDHAALKEALGSKYNNFSNNFRNHLTPSQKDQYKDTPKPQREEWIYQWYVDPTQCNLTGFNRTTAIKKDTSKVKETWLTESQLGGPKYLNNPEHAHLLVLSGDRRNLYTPRPPSTSPKPPETSSNPLCAPRARPRFTVYMQHSA